MIWARGAAKILESHFGNVGGVEGKAGSKSDLVSAADKESEAYLKAEIGRRFPGHGILGEEGTDEQTEESEFIWVLDPLDGTLNYINGLPIYAVSIGVLHNGVPEVGCIWTPWPAKPHGVLFHACKGQGAFKDDMPVAVKQNPAPQPGQLAIFHRDFRMMYTKNAGPSAPIGEGRGPGSPCLRDGADFQWGVPVFGVHSTADMGCCSGDRSGEGGRGIGADVRERAEAVEGIFHLSAGHGGGERARAPSAELEFPHNGGQ